MIQYREKGAVYSLAQSLMPSDHCMKPITVFDYEMLAQTRLDAGTWAYFSGGADDEVTLRANRKVFEHIQFHPQILVDVSVVDMTTTALGLALDIPIFAAPVGFQGLAHLEGECATAQAFGAAGSLMIVSTFSSRSLEEIAQLATGPLWFQLSAPSRLWIERLVNRTEAAGYRALVVGVDAPRSGSKERAARLDFHLPAIKANFGDEPVGNNFSSLPTWESLAWLRSLTNLPLVLKGVLTADAARLAVEHGMDGIIVSNHGGRQLDGVPATLEVLPEIVETVNGRCEVYMDSGIRRGTDILKALALGAHGVFIGRPIVWGLAVNGTDGVRDIVSILRAELEQALALVGCPAVKHVSSSFIRRKSW
jgi:isopentenyl diphosphate isomerase/L-lactate dehydrogenase-like FMN-dependent dehydrogenase